MSRFATKMSAIVIMSGCFQLAIAESGPDDVALSPERHSSDTRSSDKEFFDTSAGRAPFSSAVRVGKTLYLSGMLGMKERKLVSGGTGPETAQALQNIKTRLSEHGLTTNDVVKCTVFLANIADFSEMNAEYTATFKPPRPARSALGVQGLALGARVEIECIAAL